MIFRVKFRLGFYDAWKDFDTLFDACNYAAEVRGTKFEHSEGDREIERLRIEFIEKEDEEEEAPTASNDNESSTSAHA